MKLPMVLPSADMHSYVAALCPHHGSTIHVVVLSLQTLVEVLAQDQVVSAHRSFINILEVKMKHLNQIEHLFC